MTIAATQGALAQPITLKLTLAQEKMFADQIEAAALLRHCERRGLTITMRTGEGASWLLNRLYDVKPKTTNEYRVWDAVTTKLTAALQGKTPPKRFTRKQREEERERNHEAATQAFLRSLSPADRIAADVAWGEKQRAQKAGRAWARGEPT